VRTLKKIAVVAEDYALQTPAQQLVDRFLIGYPADGAFHRPKDCEITIYLRDSADNRELDQRSREFGLRRASDLAAALLDADGVMIFGKGAAINPDSALLRETIQRARPGSACFVYGALSSTLEAAKQLAGLAEKQRVPLMAGTSLPFTWRLPSGDLALGTRLKEALIVIQGLPLKAELDGLDGLLPLIARRRGGESGIRQLQSFKGSALWRAGDERVWSWKLLASALSRSNSPQGDPVKDGRTQDLAGLGLVPKLARDPRGWVLEHHDGLKSTILVLDGVVADYNFALEARDETITSAQIYRPPAPAQHEFSQLAEGIEDFLRTAKTRWPTEASILTAGLLEVFGKTSPQEHEVAQTPELKIAFQTPR